MPKETLSAAELDLLAQLGISQNIGLYIVPILLGFLFDAILLGIAITQYLHWWQNSRNDRLFNRIIIGITGVLGAGTSIFNTAWMMHLFAYGFARWFRFFELDWLRWLVLLDVLTVATVQTFYLERLYQLCNRSKWILVLIVPLLTASVVGGIGGCVACGFIPDATQIVAIEPFFYLWIGGTLACGLLMTVLISYRLIKAQTGWSSTDWLMMKLVKLSIESQLPSTIVAIAFMISYRVRPVDGLNVFFELFHPKIYIVAFMALLNARSSLKKEMTPPPSLERKDNTYNLDGNGLTQQTVMMDQITYNQGITLPSLIIDIDRIPRDPEAMGELRRERDRDQMIKSLPSDISPSPNPSPITDSRLDFDQAPRLDMEQGRNRNEIDLDTKS